MIKGIWRGWRREKLTGSQRERNRGRRWWSGIRRKDNMV